MRTLLIAVVVSIFTASTAFAQTAKEYRHTLGIGGGIGGEVIIVGLASGKKQIQKLIDIVTERAQEANRIITADIGRINAGGVGQYDVDWMTAECLASAYTVSKKTKIDILALTGKYNGINIDVQGRTVNVKKPDTTVSCHRVINGYLAEFVTRLINQSGMHNALVRVGTSFRGMGRGVYAPWKMLVSEDSTKFAKHALNIQLSDTGAATLSSGNAPIKSATVVFANAAEAEGLAHALMTTDPTKGLKLLTAFPAHGLLIDNQGKFLRQGM